MLAKLKSGLSYFLEGVDFTFPRRNVLVFNVWEDPEL